MSKKKRDKRAKVKRALPIKRAEVFKDKREKRQRTRSAKQRKVIDDNKH